MNTQEPEVIATAKAYLKAPAGTIQAKQKRFAERSSFRTVR